MRRQRDRIGSVEAERPVGRRDVRLEREFAGADRVPIGCERRGLPALRETGVAGVVRGTEDQLLRNSGAGPLQRQLQ